LQTLVDVREVECEGFGMGMGKIQKNQSKCEINMESQSISKIVYKQCKWDPLTLSLIGGGGRERFSDCLFGLTKQ
jgi:hypothetical protein